MQTFNVKDGDEETTFEGKVLDQKILGSNPENTKQITYYETLDGRYLKHTIHGVNLEEEEQSAELEEVSSFEIP